MGQILTRLDSTQLVSGQVDKIIVAFGLTEEWSGMSIVARFCKDLQSEIYDIELSSDYEAEIPHEVMDSAGTFQMSLRGEKDDHVITSNAVSYTVMDTILGVGVSSEPTETIYDKIASSQEINAALNAAVTAQQNAKTSEINAKASENSARSSAQNSADSANAAKNYAAATYASAGNVLTKTVSGQLVHVEDAFEGGQIRGFKIKGQSKQNTTTGKNLLDPSSLLTRLTYNQTTYSLDDDYNVVVHRLDENAWNSIENTLHLDAGTYTFSTGSNQQIDVVKKTDGSINKITGSQTIVFDSSVDLKIKLFSTSGSYPVTMNCQIEKGDTATDYEPYTGGKPSPSPDYPQKISVIENPKIVIDNVEYSITMPEEHPYLASINGTNNTIADELVIDDSGVGYVIARVFRDYITEVSSYAKPDSYFFVKTNIEPFASVIDSDGRGMLIADKMYTSNKMNNFIYRTWNSVIVGNFSGSSKSDAIAIIDSVKPVTIYAGSPELMYHISIDNMPKQLSSNLVGNCICDDPSISPEIEVTYERDLNAVIAKLESQQE